MASPNYIYRECSLDLQHNKTCANFLRWLAACNGSIVSSMTVGDYRGATLEMVREWTMFFVVRFTKAENLEKFHTKFQTKERGQLHTN